MKVIIAGSRELTSMALIEQAILDSGFDVTEVVCGDARGVDSLGAAWAEAREIPVTYFPADWRSIMKKASGFVRNGKMADYADALVAVWDGKSRGTQHMLAVAKLRNLKIFLYKVD